MANTQNVGDKLARRQLHRLVRCWRRKTGETWRAKLLHRCAHEPSECLHVCAAGSLVSPQARVRALATERLQLSLDVADRAEVRSTAPRRPPVASPHAAPERRLSLQARPSQCRREPQTQSVARTERVLPAAHGLADTRSSNRDSIARLRRTTTSFHLHARCRSHLTKHKISDEDGSATPPRRKITSYAKVTHRSGPRSLHRLVRW